MSANSAPFEVMRGPITKADPGNGKTIAVDRYPCLINLISTTAETRTLSAPEKEGALVTLHMQTDGGDITVTVTNNYNETGDSTFVFTEVGQFATFVGLSTSAGVKFWRLISHYGIANMSPLESGSLDGLTATAAEINARAAAASRQVLVTDAATYTVLAANSGKTHIMPDFTSTCTLALPAASAGLEYLFISKALAADGQDWRFQVAEAGVSFIGGLGFCDVDTDVIATVFPNGSSNDFMSIVTPAAGTRIYVISDGTNWIVNGQVFSNTTPSFADT